MASIQDLWCGKTSQVRSVRTKGKTSEKYSKASAKSNQPMLLFLNLQKGNGRMQETSWQMISPSHGESLMLSIGEFPKEESVSTLLQILQANVPEKYYLSQKELV